MPCTFTVLYPSTGPFDLEYYKTKHMPLVAEEFKPYGFIGYRVVHFTGTPAPGVEAPYQVQCSLVFESPENIGEALKAKGEKVMADIPNFTETTATMMIGEVVAAM